MSDDWDESKAFDYPISSYTPVVSNEYYNSGSKNSYNRGDKWRSGNASSNTDNRNGNRGAYKSNFRNSKPVIIKIPTKFVGRVIGKGGNKISDLQFESGAKINVTKDTEEDNTIVKLFGTSEEVAKAEELIKGLTVEREYRREREGSNFYREASNFSRETSNFPEEVSNFSEVVKQETEVDDEPLTADNWRYYLELSEKREKEEWAKLPPIVKEFYEEHPDVASMSDAEVDQFRRENNNVMVSRTFETADSKPIPKPVKTFEQAFHNYPEILEEIRKAGFDTPSPIQSQAWPVILSGEDLIGIAQTGTGKTLAFLLPAFIHIAGQNVTREERGGPAVLIMAPTRELAQQIEKEIRKYKYKDINAVCLYGGGNRREQVKIVTNGVDIIIATPGRLNDLVQGGHVNLKTFTYVVLDEADRMLDMGFEPQIRKVMYAIRPNRQTIMTSATWPPGVRSLAKTYMVDPVQIHVGSLDLAATHTVRQVIELLPDDDDEKMQKFFDFVQDLHPKQKIIAFCRTKARTSHLASELALRGIGCESMHGDMEQTDREQSLADFKSGASQILIATDLASRGLDIDDITHVVNIDFPRNIEEYVHRVGRTGRAGKSGESISYFTRGDWSQANELIQILEEAEQFVPDELYNMSERYTAWKEKKDASRSSHGGGRNRYGGNRRW